MNFGCGNSLQVSTQVCATIAGIPGNFSGAFLTQPQIAALGGNTVTVPVGASPVPLGSLTVDQLGFLFLVNQDMNNPLFVSQHADGSAPFAEIAPGEHAVIPTVPGQAYFLRADSAPITAVVVAASS